MRTCYADLHVHLGSARGRPVKMGASRDLTLAAAVRHSATRTGVDLLGIVDMACLAALADLEEALDRGELAAVEGGGFRWSAPTGIGEGLGEVVLIPGAEVEIGEPGRGPAHWLAYFPDLSSLKRFAAALAAAVTNPNLSTQRARWRTRDLVETVTGLGGVVWPAHAFTPHKGLFGACAERLADVLDPAGATAVIALELGLSADTGMADRLPDSWPRALVSNSDAHSAATLAREYNELRLARPCFEELRLALLGREGRGIAANYGLDPRLGKYHRTLCLECGRIAGGSPPVTRCESCGSERVTVGVLDRIEQLARRAGPPDPSHPQGPPPRPPYRPQVPLRFLPGVGPRTLEKLYRRFGTEMAVLHRAPVEEIADAVGPVIAGAIERAREGLLALVAGGGGRYGRVGLEQGRPVVASRRSPS